MGLTSDCRVLGTTVSPKECSQVCMYSVENLVASRRNRFIYKYGETRQLSMSNVVLTCIACLAVVLLRFFNLRLLYSFIYFLLPYKVVK